MIRPLLTDTLIWRIYRQNNLQREYLKRVERYAQRNAEVPREHDLHDILQRRLSARGWRPAQRRVGEVHTFAVIPSTGWHQILIDTLREMGRVISFSFEGDRFLWRCRRRRNWLSIRAETNREILQEVQKAHREHPIDWVFFYTEGMHLLQDTVRQIRETHGIPTVMMCLDDKQSWEGEQLGGQWTGQVDLVPEFDLYWTSARACCAWVAAEGGRPLYMPEGCDPTTFKPLPGAPDIPVSFVGSAYGFRKDLIAFLRKWGVPVTALGKGWGGDSHLPGVEDLVTIFNRSQINLGHGGIGYSETLTNVKGRDFDVPCTGGGMYLTTFNSDLARHFRIGEEIACYQGREELIDLIHHYLRRSDERREMARRARERCLREHRWSHRYIQILQLLGVLNEEAVPPPLPEDVAAHSA